MQLVPAVVGWIVAGPAGARWGLLLGSLLFGPHKGRQEAAKASIAELSLTWPAKGQPLPILYGRRRIPGHIIWHGDFEAHKQEEGGEGGGKKAPASPTIEYYTYTVGLGIALCEGHIVSVPAIWSNDKDVDLGEVNVVTHLGTVPQVSDGYIDIHLEAGQISLTYPGVAYSVLRDWPLGRSSAVPNLTFETLRTSLVVRNANSRIPASFAAYGDTAAGDLNPVIALLDFLTHSRYGCDLPAEKIDFASFHDAAEYCSLVGLHTSPYLADRQSGLQHVEDILATFDGILTYWGGQFHLRVRDHWTATWPAIEEGSLEPAGSLISEDVHPRRASRTCTDDNATLYTVLTYVDGANLRSARLCYSLNQGRTWSDAVLIEGDPGTWTESWSPDIIAGPDGMVHVAWVANNPGAVRGAVRYRVWDPVTMAWVGAIADLTDDSAGNNWLFSEEPDDVALSVDAHNAYAHAVVQSPTTEPGAAAGRYELHYCYRNLSDPDPTAWTQPARITDFAVVRDKAWPSIVNGADGHCHVAYVSHTEYQTAETSYAKFWCCSHSNNFGEAPGETNIGMDLDGAPGLPDWDQFAVTGTPQYVMAGIGIWTAHTVNITSPCTPFEYTSVGRYRWAGGSAEDNWLDDVDASYTVHYATFDPATPLTASEAVDAAGPLAGAAHTAIALGGTSFDRPMVVWAARESPAHDHAQVWFSERIAGAWSVRLRVSDLGGMDGAAQQQPTFYLDTSGRPTVVWAGPSTGFSRPQIWRRIRRDDGTWVPIRAMTAYLLGVYAMPRTTWRQWMPQPWPLGLLYSRYAFDGAPGIDERFYTGRPTSGTYYDFQNPLRWNADPPPDGYFYTDGPCPVVASFYTTPTPLADLYYAQIGGGDAEFEIRPEHYVKGEPPVVARRGRRDTTNTFRVIYYDRENAYMQSVAERQHDWSVIETGKRIDEVRASGICDRIVADRIASHQLMQHAFEAFGVTLTVGPQTAFLTPPASIVMWRDEDFSAEPLRLRVANIEESKPGVYRLHCIEEP